MNKNKIQEEKVERIYSWSQGEKEGPVEAEIFPTSGCNLRCVYCSVPEDNPTNLSKDRLRKTVDTLLSIGVKEFSFSGGEPFIRPDTMLEIMRMVKKGGARGCVISNGTLFTENIVEEIVDVGWDEVQISLDAPDAPTNDSTRGYGVFKKIVRSLEKFKECKRSAGSEKPQITVNMVLSETNWDKIVELIEFMNEMDCDSLLIQALFEDTPQCKNLKMKKSEQERFKELVKRADKLSKKYGISTNLEGFLDEEYIENSGDVTQLLEHSVDDEGGFLNIPCYQPWYRIAIKEDGSVGPCGILADNGNLNINDNSIRDIWNNLYDKLREGMLKGNLSESCEKCCTENIFHNEFIRNELRERLSR